MQGGEVTAAAALEGVVGGVAGCDKEPAKPESFVSLLSRQLRPPERRLGSEAGKEHSDTYFPSDTTLYAPYTRGGPAEWGGAVDFLNIGQPALEQGHDSTLLALDSNIKVTTYIWSPVPSPVFWFLMLWEGAEQYDSGRDASPRRSRRSE